MVDHNFTDNQTVEGIFMIAVDKLNLWNVVSILFIGGEEVTHYGPIAVVKLQFSLSTCSIK